MLSDYVSALYQMLRMVLLCADLIACVIEDHVHEQLHITLLELGYQFVHILKATIDWVDIFVV